MMGILWQNLLYRARMWLKKPGFALMVVLTLGLGMASGTALLRAAYGQAREEQSRSESPDALESPRLAMLAREIKAGNRAAVQQFWEDLKGKAPLIETIPEHDNLRLVTFLWRGGDESGEIRFIGTVPLEIRQKPLNRLADTDVWFLTARFQVTARFSYAFERAGKWLDDPLNPLKYRARSFVELPGASPQPWIRIQPEVAKGTLKPEKLSSKILKEEREFTVYTPAGYDPQRGKYGVVVLFDGEEYRSLVPTPTILDNLVASKKIPPLVALLVDHGSIEARDRDLQCSAPFADFLAKELLPWAREHYRLSADPKQTIIGGSSYGGLSAAYCAFRYPEVFGNVLSQSGSFGYYPGWHGADQTDASPFGWLIRQFVTTRKLPLRFYLEAGLFETAHAGSILPQNRRLRDVLEAKGYALVYSEFVGAHEYLSWRGSLADGLIALTGQEKTGGQNQ